MIDSDLESRLRAHLRATINSGRSIRAIAAQAGISNKTLERFVLGQVTIKISTASKILGAIGPLPEVAK